MEGVYGKPFFVAFMTLQTRVIAWNADNSVSADSCSVCIGRTGAQPPTILQEYHGRRGLSE